MLANKLKRFLTILLIFSLLICSFGFSFSSIRAQEDQRQQYCLILYPIAVNDVSRSLTNVLVEANGSNAIQNYYVYGSGFISQGPSLSTSRLYPLTDGMGNIRLLTDSAGNIVKSYNYDPFGNIRSTSGTSSTNYQFSSEQLDPETELYFLRARYYDPKVGRFITRDPVKGILSNPQSLNPYQYAYNNPVNLSDPSGKFIEDQVVNSGFSYNPNQIYFMPVLEAPALIITGIISACVNMVSNYHGNDLRYQGPTTGYKLIDNASETLMKNGISNTPDTRYTQKWLEQSGLYLQKVIEGTRAEMYEWEYQQNLEYFNKYGQLPPLNKNFH